MELQPVLAPWLFGRARALGIAFLGDTIDALTSFFLFVIWKFLLYYDLIEDALLIAKKLASGPTKSYALIRQAINAADTNSFDEQLDFEMQCQRAAGYTGDHAEGVSAIIEKRPARFKGQWSMVCLQAIWIP